MKIGVKEILDGTVDLVICTYDYRSIGIIIGIVLAGVAVLSTIVIIIICCYSAKRKRENRTGSIISTRPSASVIYTG